MQFLFSLTCFTGQPVSTIFSTVQNLSHLYPASL